MSTINSTKAKRLEEKETERANMFPREKKDERKVEKRVSGTVGTKKNKDKAVSKSVLKFGRKRSSKGTK